MQQSTRRLSGRWVAFGFGAVVVGLVCTVLGLWFRGREPNGPIRAVAPIDATRALVLREGYRQHDFVHLTLRDIARGQAWSVPFHAVPTESIPVATRTRAALWVLNHARRLEIHAFDLESGRFAFRALEQRVPTNVTPHVDLAAVGDRIVASYYVTEPHVAILDATTGRVLGDYRLDPQEDAPTLVPRAADVLVRTHDGVERLANLETGELRVAPPGFGGTESPRLADIPLTIVARVDGTSVPLRTPARTGDVYWAAAGTSLATIDVNSGRILAHVGPAEWSARPRPVRR